MIDHDEPDDLDPELEWKLRAIAVPAAFVIALGFYTWPAGHALQRTFLTMIPHELGHAVTAWFSGYLAIPSLWKTILFDGQRVAVIAVVALGNAGLAWYGWRRGRDGLVGCALVLGVFQTLMTTASASTALAAFTFGGDAGAMVIGTLLVLTFFAAEGSKLRHGALRWGLLAIGAATLVDTFMTWWTPRIPYGEIEGVGLSDPSKLERVHGWSTDDMIDRYLMLGTACFLVIAAAYARGVLTMRRLARG